MVYLGTLLKEKLTAKFLEFKMIVEGVLKKKNKK